MVSHFAGQNDRKRGAFYEKAPLFLVFIPYKTLLYPFSAKLQAAQVLEGVGVADHYGFECEGEGKFFFV